jgi:hypothetical protein
LDVECVYGITDVAASNGSGAPNATQPLSKQRGCVAFGAVGDGRNAKVQWRMKSKIAIKLDGWFCSLSVTKDRLTANMANMMRP